MAKNQIDEQIARMRSLMNISESKDATPAPKKNAYNLGVLEYHTTAANGKTYGIVREGTKYYIKEAPKKDTEVILEDYEYIGGYCNKKRYEYDSYSSASKNLEMKLMSIKESLNDNTIRINEECDPFKKMNIGIERTNEMQKEIERQRQILENVGKILHEKKGDIDMTNLGTPEAPKSSTNDSKGKPFTNAAKATLDKDPKTAKGDCKKAKPFDENGEVSDSDMESDKNPKGGDETFSKKAENVPNGSVANQHPKGGKAVKVNEGKRTIKMTEEQVLAWNKNKDYMDTSTETHIGDGEPFDKKVSEGEGTIDGQTDGLKEGEALHTQGDNQNKPTPGQGEIGDGDPFDKTVSEGEGCKCTGKEDCQCEACKSKKNECGVQEGMENECGMTEDLENDMAGNYAVATDDDYSNADLEFEKEWNDWLNDTGDYNQNGDNDFNNEPSLDDDNPYQMDFDPTYGFDNPYYESKQNNGQQVNEDKLDVFGKTPGYRKEPMTTPPNTEIELNGSKDWNDDSVKGDKPFGEKVGKSDPFTILIGDVLELVKEKLSGEKKKS